jgi:Arc/MetJ-type ribon-helix-helix transcriptional regulator
MAKIAVTLPEELVAEAKRAVDTGRATSVSAYVAAALAAQHERQGLRAYVDALIAEHGKPSKDDYAWADDQVRKATRRRPTR